MRYQATIRTVLGIMVWIVIGLFCLQHAWAGNISDTYKYAWNENAGWHNWRSSSAQATVETTYLSGYVWAENVGWIKLGADAGGPYANTNQTNWGVNLDSGTGALSGYAWSENVGWINFDSPRGGVTMDMTTNKFDGYAWGERIGWIHFQNASPQYYVMRDLTAPTVTTQAVTGVGTTTATGNGNVTDLGSPNPTQHGVCWSTSSNPTVTLPTKTEQGAKSSTGGFTSDITPLSPNTDYYVRAYATNLSGTVYGNNVQFTTAGPPTATTGGATSVQNSSAVLNGTVNPNGLSTTVVFEYGTTTFYGSQVTASQSPLSGTGNQSVSATLTGLSPETTYHFRTSATSSAGSATGTDGVFSTGNVIYVSLNGCGDKSPCYASIQSAIDDAVDGTVIKVKGGTYGESLSAGGGKSILIKGGYDSNKYDQQVPNTTVIDASGATRFSAGGGSALRFEMISVQSLK